MDITNPRRLLAVSLEDATQHLARVIKDLTGTPPLQTSTTLAGASHTLPLRTAYYQADIPIWLDLVSSPTEWSTSFLSPEAKEVLEVLGGIIVVFAIPPPPSSSSSSSSAQQQQQQKERAAARDLIQNIGQVVQRGLGGWSWDGVSLCLGIGEFDDVEEWEEIAAESGLEFVQVRGSGSSSSSSTTTSQQQQHQQRNEFGEKTGIPRALEALEANEWDQPPSILDDDGGLFDNDDDDDDDDFGTFQTPTTTTEKQKGGEEMPDEEGTSEKDLDPSALSFGFDPSDFSGLKRAIMTAGQEEGDDEEEDRIMTKDDGSSIKPTIIPQENNGGGERGAAAEEEEEEEKETQSLDEDDVEKIQQMMLKLQAVRDTGAGLPEDQRRRMAAKAVGEVMREL